MIFPANDIYSEAPNPTPLYAAAAAVSDANLWTSVNGFSLAKLFTSVEKEYKATRTGAAMTDLSPLSRYAIRGSDSSALLSRMTTAPAPKLEVGESARGLILDSEGCVLDLAEVSRLAEDLFLLITPRPHARRMKLAARGLNATGEDISETIGALGVFGPNAYKALADAGLKMPGENVAASGVLNGVETAARPIQFSALQGAELIFPASEALVIWERLMRRGKAAPMGLDVMNILRIESGAPRPGVDFISAEDDRDSARRLPTEIGLPHLAPLNRGWYNGRRGLRYGLRPSRRRLITLTVEEDRSTPGAAVFCDEKSVGRITSCAWSPSLKRVIAFADVVGSSIRNDYHIAAPPPGEGRIAARIYENPESRLADDFEKSRPFATE